jgi:type II secretory pathway component PulM
MERQINQNQSLIKASQLTEKGSSKSKTSNAKGSLITQIERSAKQVQIYSSIERISPDKTGRVKVWLNNGNFSLLLTWIESLKKNGIDIVDVRANQLELNSSVSITVTFQLS